MTCKNYDTFYLHYFSWFALIAVLLFELIFLVNLLVDGNDYILTITSYDTLRVDFTHTFMEITLLFGMGTIGILTLLVTAVAS